MITIVIVTNINYFHRHICILHSVGSTLARWLWIIKTFQCNAGSVPGPKSNCQKIPPNSIFGHQSDWKWNNQKICTVQVLIKHFNLNFIQVWCTKMQACAKRKKWPNQLFHLPTGRPNSQERSREKERKRSIEKSWKRFGHFELHDGSVWWRHGSAAGRLATGHCSKGSSSCVRRCAARAVRKAHSQTDDNKKTQFLWRFDNGYNSGSIVDGSNNNRINTSIIVITNNIFFNNSNARSIIINFDR